MIRNELSDQPNRRLLGGYLPVGLAWIGLALLCSPLVLAQDCFGLRFLDEQTHRPIPLVEIQTVHHSRMVSDNDGWIAIDDPDLLGSEVFFSIQSHGYEFPKDGFGFAGKAFKCLPGQTATVLLKRVQLAERLYRTTGLGRYVHAQRLGKKGFYSQENSHNRSLFESPVGCDSVLTAVLGEKLVWFWGDTSALHYPIGGSFHMTGALTDIELPNIESQPPSYEYFKDTQNRVRALAQMPGDGPTWISGLTVLKDNEGNQVMLANYVKVRKALEAYRWGFVRWNPATNSFDQVVEFQDAPKLFPPSQTHTFQHSDSQSGSEYVYLCGPFPNRRVIATPQAFIDPTQYQGYTCLQDGTNFEDRKLDRNPSGQLIYRWRPSTLPLTQAQEVTLVREKRISDEERLFRILDVDSNREIQAHNGSVVWNPYRKSWSMIFTELEGKNSMLGEVWYSESLLPQGPWKRAKKVATHHQYSFYNPKIHPQWMAQEGRVLYFEGTYTSAFSGNQVPTPRYDYNQILYRLDLGAFPESDFQN